MERKFIELNLGVARCPECRKPTTEGKCWVDTDTHGFYHRACILRRMGQRKAEIRDKVHWFNGVPMDDRSLVAGSDLMRWLESEPRIGKVHSLALWGTNLPMKIEFSASSSSQIGAFPTRYADTFFESVAVIPFSVTGPKPEDLQFRMPEMLALAISRTRINEDVKDVAVVRTDTMFYIVLHLHNTTAAHRLNESASSLPFNTLLTQKIKQVQQSRRRSLEQGLWRTYFASQFSSQETTLSYTGSVSFISSGSLAFAPSDALSKATLYVGGTPLVQDSFSSPSVFVVTSESKSPTVFFIQPDEPALLTLQDVLVPPVMNEAQFAALIERYPRLGTAMKKPFQMSRHIRQ